MRREEVEEAEATRELLLAWLGGYMVDFSKHLREPDWAKGMNKVAVHTTGSQIRAKLFDPYDKDLQGGDSIRSKSRTSNNPLPPKLDELQRALAPEPNDRQKTSLLNVEMLDLDGLLDFRPREEVLGLVHVREKWGERSSLGWEECLRGSLVLELIADPNFTADEFLGKSRVLHAILELKWLRMGQLAWFPPVLTVLWALSFTAFSAMRQYTEFDDDQVLIWICLVLSIMQIVVMLAMLGRWVHVWWKGEAPKHLMILAMARTLPPILVWACVALASGQILWLLNCLSTFAVQRDLKEMRRWSNFTDAWSIMKLLRSTASLLMVCILLAGLTQPRHTVGVMFILTFLGWGQIAKEGSGRWVFIGVYSSLIHGVMQATFTFMLQTALTFGWWLLSRQRPDAHILQQEEPMQCGETATGYVCVSIPQSHSSTFTRLWASFTFSDCAALLADFVGDVFALADYNAFALPGWLFFFCIAHVNLIVLVNLFIAARNSTFEELWIRARAVFLRQRARVCLEFERTVGYGLGTEYVGHKRIVFSYPGEGEALRYNVKSLENAVELLAWQSGKEPSYPTPSNA